MSHMPKVQNSALVSVFILILLLGGALYFLENPFFEKAPSGTLYLGLAEQNSFIPKLHAYDIKTKTLSPLNEQTFGANTLSFAPDGEKFVFSGWKETGNSQLYVINESAGYEKQLTTDALKRKRTPKWSPDGFSIAFTATESDSPEGVKDWGVYVSDLDGRVIRVAPGMYPLWLSETRGLFLGTDGIYAFDVSQKALGKVIRLTGGNTTENMRIAISPDLKHFAWSIPDKGTIYIYDVASLDPLVFEKSKEIASNSFWVVFSPNSKYLAAQEVEWGTLETAPNPRIVAFNLKDDSRTELLNLSAYNQQAMFLSDWR